MKPVWCLRIAAERGEDLVGHRKGLSGFRSAVQWCFLWLQVNVNWALGEDCGCFSDSPWCFLTHRKDPCLDSGVRACFSLA